MNITGYRNDAVTSIRRFIQHSIDQAGDPQAGPRGGLGLQSRSVLSTTTSQTVLKQ